jgi:hypothetical protein
MFARFLKIKLKDFASSSRGRIYLGGCLTYTGAMTYYTGKNYVNHYREKALHYLIDYSIDSYEDRKNIKTEWDAIYYGTHKHLWKNALASVIWPVYAFECVVASLLSLALAEPKSTSTQKTS